MPDPAPGAIVSHMNVKRRIRLLLGCGLVLAGSAAQAHHSIAGFYDSRRQATVDGVVTQFQFVSPHPMLSIKDTRSAQLWILEMDNRREMEDIGMTAETLKPGDRLVVTGSLARREGNRMYIDRLERPADGYAFEQVGSRPRLRRR
jgi:hypothetical protein